MLIGLDELPDALRQQVAALRACVLSALHDFVRDHTTLRGRYSPRTEASIIHDYMVDGSKERFDWKLKRNLFLIAIEGFRAKLKKLNGRWRASSVPTQLALDFERQRPLRLFDDVEVTNLFLGYTRDEGEILKSRVWLVCPNGRRRLKWACELTANEQSGALTFAVPSKQPDMPGRRRRVGPKTDVAKKNPKTQNKE